MPQDTRSVIFGIEQQGGIALRNARFCNEFINMVDNHSSEITLRRITAPNSTELLAQGLGKR